MFDIITNEHTFYLVAETEADMNSGHILLLEEEGEKKALPVSPSLKYESPCYVTSCLDQHFSTTFPRILFDS
ncbi:hypothetical protein I79_017798 [Cricetulus griseus]|uniref:Uncharacterized protein n=1 Tax=Cricetulus griseus TaxID=10029 RepID=G3I300_CRIGR|nr:hypothetical protein I79_017798 [Cricetulus griseus]